MLNPAENADQPAERQGARAFFAAGDASQPDESVQLIHRAVSLDARGIFRNALPPGESSLAFIAALGVDAVERDARVVKRPFRHASHVTCVSMRKFWTSLPSTGSSCWPPPRSAES